MVDAIPMAERHARLLTELAELGMVLARKLQARAMAAETTAEERAAANTFHRISRSLRQTLALEAQLERLRRRMLAEDIEAAAERTEAAVTRRKAQAGAVIERLIWREHDDEDQANHLVEHMQHLIDEDALDEDFLCGPIKAYLDRLRDDLRLPPDEPDEDPKPVAQPATAPISSAHPRAGGDPSGDSASQSEPGSPASPFGRADGRGGGDHPWRSSG
jgi:hypothetical protein